MKFPKFLYVTVENEGSEDEFLNTSADPADHAEVNSTIEVAKYQRVDIGTVMAPAIYTGDDE